MKKRKSSRPVGRPKKDPQTTDVRRRISKMMLKHSGNIPEVAIEMGWTARQTARYIENNSEMRNLWLDPIAPRNSNANRSRQYITDAKAAGLGDDGVLDIGPPEKTKAELRKEHRAEQIEAEEVQLVKVHGENGKGGLGWEALGITNPKTINFLNGFEKFIGKNITSILDVTFGGMTFAFAQTAVQLAEVSKELEGLTDKPSDDPRKMVAHARFMELAKLQKTLNSEATQAAYTRLLAEQKSADMTRATRMKKARAGFRNAKQVK